MDSSNFYHSNQNELLHAAYLGDITTIEKLISDGFDPNTVNKLGSTALMYAAQQGHLEIVKRLIAVHKVNVNAENYQGNTALMMASQKDYVEVVKALLLAGATVDNVSKKGWNAISIALYKKVNPEIIHSLISAGANISEIFLLAAQKGCMPIIESAIFCGVNINQIYKNETALITATKAGHIDIINLLVARGAKINIPDKNGVTALMYAAYLGHTEIVKFLIASGVDVNISSKPGNTALILAARNGYNFIVDILIKAGAHLDKSNQYGNTAVMMAANRNYVSTVKMLADAGADLKGPLILAVRQQNKTVINVLIKVGAGLTELTVDAAKMGHMGLLEALIHIRVNLLCCNERGETALMWAVRNRHSEIIKAIIKANPNTIQVALEDALEKNNAFGLTALASAGVNLNFYLKKYIENNQVAFAEQLISAGADHEPSGQFAKTALMFAAHHDQIDILNALIRSNVDINAVDSYGSTALNYAILFGHPEIVSALIHAKANLDIVDITGSSALVNAILKDSFEMVKLLINAKANIHLSENQALKISIQRVQNGAVDLLENGQCRFDIFDALLTAGVYIDKPEGYLRMLTKKVCDREVAFRLLGAMSDEQIETIRGRLLHGILREYKDALKKEREKIVSMLDVMNIGMNQVCDKNDNLVENALAIEMISLLRPRWCSSQQYSKEIKSAIEERSLKQAIPPAAVVFLAPSRRRNTNKTTEQSIQSVQNTHKKARR